MPALAAPRAAYEVEGLRRELELRHAAVLRGFLSGAEREWVARRLADAEFEEQTIEATGKTELLMRPNTLSAFLLFKMCDPELFAVVDAVTGGGPAGFFRGRTYRMLPGVHFSPWHTDVGQSRIAAFTVNLSPQPFEGAHLQIRRAASDEILAEVDDLEFGDAVLIQISPDLAHRNSPLLGAVPKTSHAGFFYPRSMALSPLVRG